MPNNNKTHRGTTYYKPPPIQIRRIPDKTNSPILSQYLNVVVPLAVNKKNIHRSNHVNKNKLIRFPACFSLPKRRPFPGKNSPPSQTICHFKPLFSSSPKTSSESPFILPHPVHADGALTFLETSNPPRRVAQPLWHNLSNCQKSEYAPLSKPKKKQRVLFLLYLALSLSFAHSVSIPIPVLSIPQPSLIRNQFQPFVYLSPFSLQMLARLSHFP